MRLVWTRLAVHDLTEARRYIAADNPTAAARLAMRIVEASRALQAAPHLGRAGAVRGTRDWVVGQTPYRVIYRVNASRIEILRVLPEKRQWSPTVKDATPAAAKPVRHKAVKRGSG